MAGVLFLILHMFVFEEVTLGLSFTLCLNVSNLLLQLILAHSD